MNGDTGTRPELADYLRRVRAGLADLPPEELTEIMEDTEAHVTEVFGEADTPDQATTRLGTPEDYAAELRAAGGYPPPPGTTPTPTPRRARARYTAWALGLLTAMAALTGLVTGNEQDGERYALLLLGLVPALPALWLVLTRTVRRADLEALPEYRKARALAHRAADALPPHTRTRLRALHPAWGPLRLLLLALALLAAVGSDGDAGGVLALLALGALLIWAATRARTDRRALALLIPANALVIGLGLALAAHAVSEEQYRGYYASTSATPGLAHDGQPLGNVYAVDGQGRPIEEFYLYDERGRPLTLTWPRCPETPPRRGVPEPDNRFPLPEWDDERGRCVDPTGLPFAPLPPATTTAPTTSAPTTTPTSPEPSSSTPPTSTPPASTQPPTPSTPAAPTTTPN